ncbi:MAG: 2-phosphosulfolactate phosphatase [Candidatus Nanohaloarchaeota archaeon QJJ-5]|nr:2-phosphosulfolactate phosphatase [Candidatus Nanohaloarchaeota archaeon QJJ-5]
MGRIQTIERKEELPASPNDGIYVIIDVLRFSTTCVSLLANGAEYIKPFQNTQEALSFKSDDADRIIIGESGGEQISGFDHNNSPTALQDEDVSGHKIGILTTNGTVALGKTQPQKAYIGGLVNAEAIGTMLQDTDDDIYLLAAGSGGTVTDEDLAGASLIEAYINDTVTEEKRENAEKRVKESTYADKLRERGFDEDIDHAADTNRYDIVPARKQQIIVAQDQ